MHTPLMCHARSSNVQCALCLMSGFACEIWGPWPLVALTAIVNIKEWGAGDELERQPTKYIAGHPLLSIRPNSAALPVLSALLIASMRSPFREPLVCAIQKRQPIFVVLNIQLALLAGVNLDRDSPRPVINLKKRARALLCLAFFSQSFKCR